MLESIRLLFRIGSRVLPLIRDEGKSGYGCSRHTITTEADIKTPSQQIVAAPCQSHRIPNHSNHFRNPQRAAIVIPFISGPLLCDETPPPPRPDPQRHRRVARDNCSTRRERLPHCAGARRAAPPVRGVDIGVRRLRQPSLRRRRQAQLALAKIAAPMTGSLTVLHSPPSKDFVIISPGTTACRSLLRRQARELHPRRRR